MVHTVLTMILGISVIGGELRMVQLRIRNRGIWNNAVRWVGCTNLFV